MSEAPRAEEVATDRVGWAAQALPRTRSCGAPGPRGQASRSGRRLPEGSRSIATAPAAKQVPTPHLAGTPDFRALRNSDRVERDARGTNEAGACDVRCADQPVHSHVVRTPPSSCAYARSKTSPAEQCSCSSSAGSGGLALRDRRGSRSDPRSTCVGRRTSRGGFPQRSRGTARAGGVRPSAPYAPGPWCRGELR